jgi:hypothetical protein
MMKQRIILTVIAVTAVCAAQSVWAKLPAPGDDAKAAAAAAADKAAWANKVGAFQLCMAQDRVAAQVLAQARSAGKPAQPTSTPACADPGPYVAAVVKPVEAAGAHSPAATAVGPPSTKQPDAVVDPAKKP